jgi:integrase
MRGNITRRGKNSWRLKFDVGADAAGRRKTRYVTVKGKRQDAQRELTRLLAAADAGTLPEPSKVTLGQYLREWLEGAHDLSPKTAERYRELAEQQIIPHLGSMQLQRLKPAHVRSWHDSLITGGGRGGRPLAARTVGHAHRVLHRALQRALESETLNRNVASIIRPPKVEMAEIEILDAEQVALVLHRLSGHDLFPIAALALATGMRRGELLGLQQIDIDLDAFAVQIERSLEETAQGLRLKPPKTKHGRRTISLPPSTVAVLRDHRVKQLERRLALGLGRPAADALVFSNVDGSPMSPRKLSRDWLRTGVELGLPRVMFHALRHTHASALIAAGLDVVAISRRLGHANPTVTLNIYGHLFNRTDPAAAAAIEIILGTRVER